MSDLENFRASFYPPPWLASHAEVVARDIHLVYAIKPGQVYSTQPDRFVVKIITDAASEEASIYDKLHGLGLASPNHILPCTIVRHDVQRPFIIMPCLTDLMAADQWKWDLQFLVHTFRQMVEAVELLHSHNIAHMDVAVSNFVVAMEYHIPLHDGVEVGKIHIIDFGASHQFELGPGRQPAAELPPTQARKPQGIKRLDPFSWDMYCVGDTFQFLLRNVYNKRKQPHPWILRRYAAWLIGDEKGCTAVCHRRPSARRALLVITILGWIVDTIGVFKRMVNFSRNATPSDSPAPHPP
ncbi:hypothetical protein L226DRAFT_549535 [Lentinus tigrinus ALCF2SS1-7]|uniref:Protein kinase domain-containing protein n=1 Tax=Lentinus tigrinus ALCF2SS1-6 TaxID=1328759 RepID=A0A5C2SSC4_9APHY|nr:hypothetical protein L227DRAFT_589804 [Lentinus tigrinus ALCF2SS1-6]RPD80718.1 hypothetical protein L226DRAFT_549535 [Lentinus tigrinus ALCF2SS1-7]